MQNGSGTVLDRPNCLPVGGGTDVQSQMALFYRSTAESEGQMTAAMRLMIQYAAKNRFPVAAQVEQRRLCSKPLEALANTTKMATIEVTGRKPKIVGANLIVGEMLICWGSAILAGNDHVRDFDLCCGRELKHRRAVNIMTDGGRELGPVKPEGLTFTPNRSKITTTTLSGPR